MDEQLSPRDVMDAERFLDYERGVARSPLVPRLLERIDRPGMSICDVGGASGRFLEHLSEGSPHSFRATVMDVLVDYRKRLVRPDFEFAHASIVDNDLASDQFDIITARHVLHHLVGRNIEATRALQRRGLSEMLRLTKPGGHVVLMEQIHFVRPFSRAVYYLSRFASERRIRIRTFETGRVVVSFMTPGEVRAALAELRPVQPFEMLTFETSAREVALKWKLTVLMSRVGDVICVLRKLAA